MYSHSLPLGSYIRGYYYYLAIETSIKSRKFRCIWTIACLETDISIVCFHAVVYKTKQVLCFCMWHFVGLWKWHWNYLGLVEQHSPEGKARHANAVLSRSSDCEKSQNEIQDTVKLWSVLLFPKLCILSSYSIYPMTLFLSRFRLIIRTFPVLSVS